MSATPINPAAAIEQNLRSECAHHWVIEPAEGPFSEGACQKCGEVKTFTNYVERYDWNNPGGSTASISKSPDLEQPVRAAEIEEGAAGEC